MQKEILVKNQSIGSSQSANLVMTLNMIKQIEGSGSLVTIIDACLPVGRFQYQHLLSWFFVSLVIQSGSTLSLPPEAGRGKYYNISVFTNGGGHRCSELDPPPNDKL
jgi:hypothetical protein